MSKRTSVRIAQATVALLALGRVAWAADPVPTTVIVPGADCPSCAKKVADRLYAVAGVATVRADVKAQALVVTPRPGQALSPRALWEAVEKSGKTPSRLEGPSGTFTAKPAS
ncbi:MAG: heavy-metal-associated domain-containing protein [Gemmataceae bacterium]|nr:heavy-metal-associated domain-containing protein [Gemmataceae bacterium]